VLAGQRTLLAVQLVVGADGAAHQDLLQKLTKSSHIPPHPSIDSDEFLKTDRFYYRGGVTDP